MPTTSVITPPSTSFAFPTLPLQGDKVQTLTQSLIDAHVKYGLGAKAHPLSLNAGQFHKIDCSGFVRWCFYHGTGFTVPDGPAVQHEWFDQHGFKHSSFDAGSLEDGILRIAFLSPHDSIEKIGHVLFILDKVCYESHGSTGPDNKRVWASKPWMKMMSVYVVNLAS
jgi:hypothetical protein